MNKPKLREITEEEQEDLKQRVEWQKAIPGIFAIRLQDVEEHGPTDKCGGCKSLVLKKPSQVHTEECRKRFATLIDEDKLKRSKEREAKFY